MKPLASVNKKTISILWLCCLVYFWYGSIQVNAQMPQNGLQTFEQAQSDYQNGKVFKVLQLEKYTADLPNHLKDDAYYLLFQSYVQTQQDSMALVTMKKLLKESPTIDPKKENEKFRYFYQKFESKPREVGMFVGQNYHKALTPASSNNRGFTLGLVHNQYLTKDLLIFKNLIYSDRHQTLNRRTGKYRIPGTYIGQTNIDEFLAQRNNVNPKDYPTQIYHLSGDTYPSFIELASGLQWNVLTHKKFQLFVKGGIAANYLLETYFDNGEIYYWLIDYTEENGQLQKSYPFETPFSFAEAQDAEHSTVINFHLVSGAGIRYKINDGVLFLEARWQQSLMPQEVSFISNSESFNELISLMPKRTLKFQTRTMTFSFGYLFSIQHFKKLRGK